MLAGTSFRPVILTAMLAGAACSHSLPATASSSPREWVLVWSDEFEGPAGARVDESKWRYDLGDGCQQGICGWGNNEKELYTSEVENISLNGQGQLMITARAAPPGLSCYYGACRYTSAKITTRGIMNAEPGRVEARVKLPVGQGLWPAFWMLGSGHPSTAWPACGELDIMEYRGSQPDLTSAAVHGPGYAGAQSFNHAHRLPQGSYSTDFHTFAVEWDSGGARFLVDGVAHFSITRETLQAAGPSVLDRSYYLILNLAVGGHFDGDPASDGIFPATMLVDYVRVYRPDEK